MSSLVAATTLLDSTIIVWLTNKCAYKYSVEGQNVAFIWRYDRQHSPLKTWLTHLNGHEQVQKDGYHRSEEMLFKDIVPIDLGWHQDFRNGGTRRTYLPFVRMAVSDAIWKSNNKPKRRKYWILSNSTLITDSQEDKNDLQNFVKEYLFFNEVYIKITPYSIKYSVV